MSEFFSDLARSELLRNGLIAGLLISVACGVVGTYATVRRITYIAGAIAHCVLAGMGAAGYLNHVHGISWLTPLLGAALAAVLAALLIGMVTLHFHEKVDTVLSAIWATGMALGVIFIGATPGYNQDLMSYLFGNILFVSRSDLLLVLVLDLAVLLVAFLFHTKLLSVCFDEDHARISGLNVSAYYLLLLVMIALTVVLVAQVVGIIMVIALISLPAATAGIFARRLWQMMLLATLICALSTTGGMFLSYPNLPSGSIIVLLSGGFYILGLVIRWLRRRQGKHNNLSSENNQSNA